MKGNFTEILNSRELILIDFFAEWCGPCKMVSPILQELKKLEPNVGIIKIDVDKNQSLASKYQIKGVPTLLLFKNGQQVWRQSGVLSTEEIRKIIHRHQK